MQRYSALVVSSLELVFRVHETQSQQEGLICIQHTAMMRLGIDLFLASVIFCPRWCPLVHGLFAEMRGYVVA